MPDRDSEDFVTWPLRETSDALPDLSGSTYLALEMKARRRFGGMRVYIAQSLASVRQAQRARREMRRG